jgi:outer membrane lipoprotein carrier protein
LEAVHRQSFVRRIRRIAASFAFALLRAASVHAEANLDSKLHAIENRYNHAQTLRLDFSESYSASHKLSQTESGVLYLRKPGRMRWEYLAPAGKMFLADGKDTWLYTPENHHAQKSSLKLSDDARAPLAFLLGKLDFHKDFQSVASRSEDSVEWIVALPRSQNLPYARVEFQADPDGRIARLRVTNQDQSRIDYTFANEQLNVPLAAGLFAFHPPVGTEIRTEPATPGDTR